MSPAEEINATGVSSTEFFDSIGSQAERTAATTEGAQAQDTADDERVVEEIESLCMNCHENVRALIPSPISPCILPFRLIAID